MEIVLIHIDLNKNESDGFPRIKSAVVINSSLKLAIQNKPTDDEFLALTRLKFRKHFPGRQFPLRFTTHDDKLKEWAGKVDKRFSTDQADANKETKQRSTKPKVLVNTIVLATDPDGLYVKHTVAFGNYVYVQCRDIDCELPKPVLLLEAVNHYFLQRYAVMKPDTFKALVGRSVYIPQKTNDVSLASIKMQLENIGHATDTDSKKVNHVIASEVMGAITIDKTQKETSSQISTRLPQKVIQILKMASSKEHIPMSKVIANCVLSKYNQTQ